jgi:hypothetical protein
MKRALLSFVAAALFLAALPLAAQTGTWTAVGSTGVVDESAAAIYAFGTTNLTFLPTSPGTIVARYNVTNTWGVSDTPPWKTLEMGYGDNNAAVSVRADLFQVNPCTGAQTLLCSVVSVDVSAPSCVKCAFNPIVNFATNLYYVQVTLSRTASTAPAPSLFTLRIF